MSPIPNITPPVATSSKLHSVDASDFKLERITKKRSSYSPQNAMKFKGVFDQMVEDRKPKFVQCDGASPAAFHTRLSDAFKYLADNADFAHETKEGYQHKEGSYRELKNEVSLSSRLHPTLGVGVFINYKNTSVVSEDVSIEKQVETLAKEIAKVYHPATLDPDDDLQGVVMDFLDSELKGLEVTFKPKLTEHKQAVHKTMLGALAGELEIEFTELDNLELLKKQKSTTPPLSDKV